MKIAILGPVDTKDFSSLIKKKDIKSLPKGHGVSVLPHIILGLLELGHNVSIITLSEDISKETVIYKNKKFKIYYCPMRKRAFRFSNGLIGRAANFWYREIQFMKQAILIDKPDIVNAHWAYEYAFAAIASKKKYILTTRDIPHVIFKYQTNLYRFVRLIMACIILRISKRITVASNYAKLQTQKYTNSPIEIIPNCLKKKFSKFKIKKKKINKKIQIVMINSGFHRRKNIKIALKAFKKFNKNFPTSSLTLYGHDMERTGICYRWAKENNLIKNVIFYGFLPGENLMKILPKYDILLHTALEETFGNIFIESMISGVPIIAGKKSGAAPEIVKGNGLLVDVTDIRKIVNGLKKYSSDSRFWSKIRNKAYKNAKKKYHYKIIVKKYLALYKKILKK